MAFAPSSESGKNGGGTAPSVKCLLVNLLPFWNGDPPPAKEDSEASHDLTRASQQLQAGWQPLRMHYASGARWSER